MASDAGRPDLLSALDAYRGRIAILFVLCVAVYFLIAFGEQAWRARQLQAQVGEQQAAIAQLDRDNAALGDEQTSLSGDAWVAYVQSRARRDLNLANPGETVLMVQWGADQQTIVPEPAFIAEQEDPANWLQWFNIFSRD